MADLTRHTLGSPLTAISVKAGKAGVNSGHALSQMGALASKSGQAIADDFEAASKRDAMNDLVNDSINPDREFHEAAYAVTVSEGLAIQDYGILADEIKSGTYKDMVPEDFQQMLKDRHQKTAERYSDNPHASLAMGKHNEFWLKNEASITSAQAGGYRVALGVKQSDALGLKMYSMRKEGVTNIQAFVDVIEDPQYSLLSADDREQSALTAITEIATELGSSDLIVQLDEVYHFSASPALNGTYRAALKRADKKDANFSESRRVDAMEMMRKLRTEGVLDVAYFKEFIFDNPELQDENGKDLMTAKEFSAFLHASDGTAQKNLAKNNYAQMYASKIPITKGTGTKKAINESAENHWDEELAKGADPITLAFQTGNLADSQPYPIKHWEDKINMLATANPIDSKGEIKPEFRGMLDMITAYGDGFENKVKYKAHFSDPAAGHMINFIERGIKNRPDIRNDEARTTAAIKAYGEWYMSPKIPVPQFESDTDSPYYKAAANALDSTRPGLEVVWGRSKKEYIQEHPEVKAQLYDFMRERLSINLMSPDTAEALATDWIDRRFTVIAGHLQDTHGVDTSIIFDEHNPDEVVNYFVQEIGQDKMAQLGEGFKVELEVENGMMVFSSTSKVTEPPVRMPIQLLTTAYDIQQDILTLNTPVKLDTGGVPGAVPKLKFGFEQPMSEEDIRKQYTKGAYIVFSGAGEQIAGADDRLWIHRQEESNAAFYEKYILGDAGSEWRSKGLLPSEADWSTLTATEGQIQKTITRQKFFQSLTDDINVMQDFYERPSNLKEEGYYQNMTKALAKKGTRDIQPYLRLAAVIEKGEGTDDVSAVKQGYTSGYDVTLGYGKFDPPNFDSKEKKLTDMTIKQVLAIQKGMLSNPKNNLNSSACGKYQIVSKTLRQLYKNAGMKLTDKFDQPNQDRLFLQLLKEAGLVKYRSGAMTQEKFLRNVAHQWASMPETAANNSKYGGKVNTEYKDLSNSI